MNFKLDTGAQTNVLTLTMYEQIKPVVPLKSTQTVLSAFVNGVKVKPLDTVQLQCIPENCGTSVLINFFVTSHTKLALLGCHSCEELGLVKRVGTAI